MKLILFALVVFFLITSVDAALLPKQFEAEFIQLKKSRITKKVKKEPILLKYKYPSQIYLKTMGNSSVTYVCNKDRVWVYTAPFVPEEKGQLQIGESSKYCFSKMFDALQNGTVDNKLYQIEEASLKTIIKFSEGAQRQIQFSKVTFHYKEAKNIESLDKMVLEYASGQSELTMELKSIKTNNNFESSQFIFTQPKNTEVIKMN